MKIVDGWLDEAIETDYSSKSSSRAGYKPTHIVLHGTAGGSSAEGIANYFKNSTVQASAHIIIDQGGNVVQGISLDDAAWANGALTSEHASYLPEGVNPNLYTISIEHVKSSTDNSDALTDIQAQKSFEVIQCLCDAYGIPKRAGDAIGGIISHADIDPVNRSRCPGPYPWNQLYAFLKGEETVLELTDPVVQMFFTDGGNGTWKCKQNGVILLGANLTFYRTHGGPALFGLPLSGEIYPAQYPNTAIVPCERALIVYDPDHKIDHPVIDGPCYLLHLEKGIGQQLLMQNANTTINALTNKINQIHTLSTL